MRRKISLEVLELLDIIDKCGTFYAASEALHKAPSAITYAIQKLENDLNIQLFKKDGRKVTMTPAARMLLAKGRGILDSVDLLQKEVIETDTGWEPKINIGVDTLLGAGYCFPDIKELYELRPGIEVTLYEEAHGGLWDSVINGKIDLAIGVSNISNYQIKGLNIIRMGSVNIHLVSSPDHPLTKLKRPLTPNDLAEHRFVIYNDTALDNSERHMMLSKKTALYVPTLQDQVLAIIQGIGIGYIPDINIRYFASKGEVVTVLPYGKDNIPLSKTLYLLSKESNQGKVLNWLIEKLRKKSLEKYRIY